MTHDPAEPGATASAAPLPEPCAVLRRRLPNRRPAEISTFEIGGVKYTACVGRFDDGGVAEIFLNVSKSGSELEKHARDASVLLSIGLQFGVPTEIFRRALSRKPNGTPDSALAYVLDLLAKESAK
jgi:hypothetical protein